MTLPTRSIPRIDPRKPQLLVPALNDVFSKVEQGAGIGGVSHSLGSVTLPKQMRTEVLRLLKIAVAPDAEPEESEQSASSESSGVGGSTPEYWDGIETYYDATDREFKIISDTIRHKVIPGQFVLRTNQLVVCRYNTQAGAYVPILTNGFDLVGVTLSEDIGYTTPGEASAIIHSTWNPSTESYTDLIEGVVLDTMGIFAGGISGAVGLAVPRQGNGRTVYELIQLSCGPPAEESSSESASS